MMKYYVIVRKTKKKKYLIKNIRVTKSYYRYFISKKGYKL